MTPPVQTQPTLSESAIGKRSRSRQSEAAEPPPPVVWHYTTWKGLYGLVKDRKLWASNYGYLNDFDEAAISQRLIEQVALEEVHEKLKEHVRRHASHIHPVYFASFSADFDSLNQWRAYASPSPGFAVGFDTKKLQTVSRTMTLRRCLYLEEEQRNLVRTFLRGFTTDTMETIDLSKSDAVDRFWAQFPKRIWERFLAGYADLASQIKRSEFAGEREWRYTTGRYGTTQQIQYRSNGTFIVPYIELDLKGIRPDGAAIEFPIVSVLIRPAANSALIKSAVQMLCGPNVKVEESRVSLRD